jgi:Acyl-coenzyme A:6-aminopenicillanic acid acyl-transferase
MNGYSRREFVRRFGIGAAAAGAGAFLAPGARAQDGQRTGAPAFEEKEVAGGPSDFLIARHVRLRGTQREIGRRLAEIAKNRHAVKPESVDPLVLRARREWYRRNWQEFFERARGAADTYGLDLETAALDVASLTINMTPAPQCSTAFYPPGSTSSGHALLSRNYDFMTGTFADFMRIPNSTGGRPMTGDPYIIESYPDRGYASLLISVFNPLGGCSDGVNSEGLCVALLADQEIWNDPRAMEPTIVAQAGLNEGEVGRFLLDTCATAEEAKIALMTAKQYYRGAPCHFIVGDRSGRSFVWDYSRSRNREHVTDGEGRPQVLTNHPLFRYRGAEDLPAQEDPLGTYNRYRILCDEIAKASGKLSLDDVKRANACVLIIDERGAPKAKNPDRTIWHSVYDCHEKTLEVDFYLGEDPSAPKGQRRSGYLRFSLA